MTAPMLDDDPEPSAFDRLADPVLAAQWYARRAEREAS